MKKNILLVLTALSLLLVGCSKPVTEPEKPDGAIVYVQNEDIGIIEYHLDFSEFVGKDTVAEIVVDHYANGEYVDSPAKFEIESIAKDKNKYTLSWIHSHVDGAEKFALILDEAVEEFEFPMPEKYEMAGFNHNIEIEEAIELDSSYYLATLLMNEDAFNIPNFRTNGDLEILSDLDEAYVLKLVVTNE